MLHTPIQINGTVIPNRLVMAPVGTRKSAPDGTVTPELLAHYDMRTKGGCFGLVIVEHSYVSPEGKAMSGQLSCCKDEDIPGLTELSGLLHRNGSKAVLQLNHAGSAAQRDVVEFSLSPSALFNPLSKQGNEGRAIPHAATAGELDAVVDAYAAAALRARAAGFDGCEIHSAHGYFLNQFYSPLTNHRADEYSGSTIEGRTKLHIRIIQAVRAAVGPGFLVAMRLGGCDYAPGGSTVEDAAAAAPLLVGAGLDLLDISGGMCSYIRPGHDEPGYFSDQTLAVKTATDIPVILAGGINSAEDADQLLREEKADLIAIARSVLKDPEHARSMMGSSKNL